MAWRPDAHKLVLFFGDEFAQSDKLLREPDVAYALTTYNVVFYGFVYEWDDYDQLANDTGGRLFSVHTSSGHIETAFTTIFNISCAQ
jgi:hypothetical protein